MGGPEPPWRRRMMAPLVRMSMCLKPGNSAATSALPQRVGSRAYAALVASASTEACCCADAGVAMLAAAAPTARAWTRPRRLTAVSISSDCGCVIMSSLTGWRGPNNGTDEGSLHALRRIERMRTGIVHLRSPQASSTAGGGRGFLPSRASIPPQAAHAQDGPVQHAATDNIVTAQRQRGLANNGILLQHGPARPVLGHRVTWRNGLTPS